MDFASFEIFFLASQGRLSYCQPNAATGWPKKSKPLWLIVI